MLRFVHPARLRPMAALLLLTAPACAPAQSMLAVAAQTGAQTTPNPSATPTPTNVPGPLSRRREHREGKRDVKRQVEALEEQWRAAQLSDDVSTMDKLLAPDYLGITMTGQVNDKPQQLERMRAHHVALTKIVLSDMKIKLLGPVAIVTSLAEIEGTLDKQPMNGRYRYTRIYRRYPDGSWKITNFEMTRTPGASIP